MPKRGSVVAVCLSDRAGPKRPVPEVRLADGHGVEGDVHAGTARQVSLLCQASAEKIRQRGLAVGAGDFAENILVDGLGPADFPVGAEVRVGEAVLAVTQIGKECHSGCAIREQVGDCVMPREGIFARVVRGGVVRAGDPVVVNT